tara:strand:+ start:228 stop:425 length:198 start_codon:yes stop_codon:yes gene_type:complete
MYDTRELINENPSLNVGVRYFSPSNSIFSLNTELNNLLFTETFDCSKSAASKFSLILVISITKSQ